ncbi:MAG: hypothetical protein HY074_17475 [Deltaproteobacteria bacterium]|nr:hypothetical protein [Deltaproteobacteria bacterium]
MRRFIIMALILCTSAQAGEMQLLRFSPCMHGLTRIELLGLVEYSKASGEQHAVTPLETINSDFKTQAMTRNTRLNVPTEALVLGQVVSGTVQLTIRIIEILQKRQAEIQEVE